MNKKITFKNKYFVSFLVIFFVLIIALVGFVTAYFVINNNADVVVQNFEKANEIVVNDPTRINPPGWVNLLIIIGIFVVIGLLAIGIIVSASYIIVYFWNRKHKKYPVLIQESLNEDNAGMHDIVHISINEDGIVHEEK